MTDSVPETPGEGDTTPSQPKRFLFLRRREPAPEAADASAPGGAPAPQAGSPDAGAAVEADDVKPDRIRPGVLRRRRRQLTSQYEQGIFDLGGLAMELHSRGLLAEDVMRRRAAEVADIRAQVDDLGAQLDQLRQERQERRQAGPLRRGGTPVTARSLTPGRKTCGESVKRRGNLLTAISQLTPCVGWCVWGARIRGFDRPQRHVVAGQKAQ